MKTRQRAGLLVGILIASIAQAFCQTNLQFTDVSATYEGNIQLTWSSTNTETYEIDEADALIDTNTGSITWNLLYNNYPSQGTNTFWLDTGNYNLSPQILNPKDMPMRFYRIVDLGPDTTSDEPSVSILSPTNNSLASGELTITVIARTDQPVLSGTKLYVNGQEMQAAETTTNYTDSTGVTNYEMDTYNINTCEWGNSTNVIFATTECESGYGDVVGSPPVATGHGVSPFVQVIFNNLVTRVSFSQPSFDPSSGQTQQVSALFPLNSDWTLHIVDVYSNVVQMATGSGMSMLYNWNGTDNGTNLPNGIYYYYISAQTNGESSDFEGGGSGGGGTPGSPPAPDFMRSSFGDPDASELWALPADASDNSIPVPLALYPPGIDTNAMTIFAASPSEIRAAAPSFGFGSMASSDDISVNPVGTPGYITPLADSQSAPPAPQRPPNNPVRGLAGSFGVCFDTYTGNGTHGYSLAPLDNGFGIGLDISMDGAAPSTHLVYEPLPEHTAEANNFISQMQHWGWTIPTSLLRVDNGLHINDLRGSGSPFNNANLGVFIGHGAYGTGSSGLDYTANGCKQMYFPITAGSSGQYLRLSEMNLGGSGTNGLKWFAIEACDSLYQANWSSMQSHGVYPYNGNLHLLLGTASASFANPNILAYWAKYMNYGNSTGYSPLTVRAAWYQAAIDAYEKIAYPTGTTITFAVAGDSACEDDMLQTNNSPSGSWFYDSQQVYPHP